MESTEMHAQYRRGLFLFASSAGLVLLTSFAIGNYIMANLPSAWINAAMLLVVASAILALRLGAKDLWVYRFVGLGIVIGLYSLAAIGPPNLLYYHLLLPLPMFFWLGHREGVVWAGGFLSGMAVLLLAAKLVGSHVYETEQALRFLSSYLFVVLIGWSQDSLRHRFSAILVAKSDQLHHEREQLEAALDKVNETDTELKRTAGELRDQSQFMETVLNSMGEGIVLCDAAGHLILFNPSAERILGMGAIKIPHAQWSEAYGVHYPDTKRSVPNNELPLSRALRGESIDDFEVFIRNENRPEGVYVQGSARPVRKKGFDEISGGVVVFRDVTMQHNMEAQLDQTISELKDQSQLMETMFRSISDGVVVTDTAGNFLFTNPRAKEITGMGPTEGPSDQWSETYGTFHPDGKTLFPSDELPLKRAMRGESVDDVELLIRNPERPEGASISVSARPLLDDERRLKGGIIVLRDITKLKTTKDQLKQAVRKSEQQTRLMETVLNSISDGVVAADTSGKYLVFNSSATRIAGVPAETKIEQVPEKYGFFLPDGETPFPPDQLPLRRAIRGESTDAIEVFIRHAGKPEGVYISVSGRPLRDEHDQTIGGVITFHDVTAIKEAEDRLQQTANRLKTQSQAMETVFNSISDGVVAADEEGNFTIFNPSAERIVGIGITDTGPDEWAGRYGIFFPDRVTPIPANALPLVLAIHGQSSDEVEMFVRNPRIPDGVYISVSGRPLLGNSGKTRGGVIVFRDVTARMLAEEALNQAFAQGRLEVVDTILHNIGNAINSVTIGVGTLREQFAQNPLHDRFNALAKAVESHQDDWIPYLRTDPQGQQVLPFILALAKDFSRAKAQTEMTLGRVESRVAHIVDIIRTQRSFEGESMTRKDLNLQKAVDDAVKLLQDSLAKRDIEVEIDCKDAPKEIRIQESRFHQMLINLTKNAIEAIDDLAESNGLEAQPRIQIRSYTEDDFLVLEVLDNGIGIDKKFSKVIFTAGYTTKKTGSGLGLHSTANFIIGSGGQIEPLSDGIGKGTTMRVMLRLSSVAVKTDAPEEQSPLRSK